MSGPTRDATLVMISSMHGVRHDGGIYVLLSFGRLIDSLAARYKHVYLSVPLADQKPDEARDHRIQAENLELIPQPFYTSSISAIKKFFGLIAAYRRACRVADELWIRGMMPYVFILYWFAFTNRCKVCHWIIANPVALMRASRRAGWIKDVFSLLYACQDQYFTRLGSWLARGWIVCNGGELGEVYKSSRTVVAVSSTVNEEDFFVREDTCQGEKCRILFVGFIRPEKGLQYLIEAVGKLKTKKLWELVIVGPWDKFPGYRTQLDNLIARLGIGDRISWEGYVPYGPQMFRYLRHCDLLVLPTLSEGAPHVLVEARANSLPLVSTTVGGIPTSVRTGHDGLLVPPKDPDALAAAIDRILEDRELRRSLIRNGLQSARALVMDRFLDVIVDALERSGRRRNPARTSSDRARTSS